MTHTIRLQIIKMYSRQYEQKDKCSLLFWNIITKFLPKSNTCWVSPFKIDALMHSVCNNFRNTSNTVGAMAFVYSDILCL
jgi:hypothetical protein